MPGEIQGILQKCIYFKEESERASRRYWKQNLSGAAHLIKKVAS